MSREHAPTNREVATDLRERAKAYRAAADACEQAAAAILNLPVPYRQPEQQGGKARTGKLSPERRSEIARVAARKRWSGEPETPEPEN